MTMSTQRETPTSTTNQHPQFRVRRETPTSTTNPHPQFRARRDSDLYHKPTHAVPSEERLRPPPQIHTPVPSEDRDSNLYHKPTPPIPSEERDSDLHHKSTPPVPSEDRDSNLYHKPTPPISSKERDSNLYNKSTPPVPSEERVSNQHNSLHDLNPDQKSTTLDGNLLGNSSKHLALRKEANDRYRRNAERMRMKYCKAKHKKVITFNRGDFVSVKVPRIDHFSTNFHHLPCVVVDVLYIALKFDKNLWTTQTQFLPLYKCKYSVLENAMGREIWSSTLES